jgi:60 kDa SS-A/Ro ribonucleoprotein
VWASSRTTRRRCARSGPTTGPRRALAEEVAALIRDHDVPLAAVPARWLAERAVWEALLPGLSPAELIDSLPRLSASGVLDDPDTAERVARAVADERRLRAARVHPLGLLAAFTRYAAGEEGAGAGRLVWTPARRILDALEAGFYAPFSVAEEAGRRWVIGLDVSEELARGGVAGVPGLTPRAAVAAMALVTAAVGAECHTVALGPDGPWELPITPRQRLNDVLEAMRALPPVAAVDCAQPVRWALERGVAADAFVVCCGGDRIMRGGGRTRPPTPCGATASKPASPPA